MKNVFIIGDSFCTKRSDKIQDLIFWVDELKLNLLEFNIMCDGEPSRDSQTIIDNWVKIIPLIDNDDFLIICLPNFGRTRLPLSEKNYRNFKKSSLRTSRNHKKTKKKVGGGPTKRYFRDLYKIEFG